MSQPVLGLVETFETNRIAGWVQVAPDAPPTEVELALDGRPVDTVWAAESSERHGDGELRAFTFVVRDLWDYVGPGNRLTVHAAGSALPIAGKGTYAAAAASGGRTTGELFERLDSGEAFTRSGALQLSRVLDAEWQSEVLALYARLRTDLLDLAGREPALAYGTLLGAVRDGGFIGHDGGFDCAFVSRHRDAAAAAHDLAGIGLALIDRGHRVRASQASLHVADPQQPDVAVTLFHLFVDEAGVLRFPYGVAGDSSLSGEAWQGARTMPFAGADVLAPAHPESVLEHVYGTGWREPDPSFRWATRRSAAVPDAYVPPASIEEIYWADFYARTTYDSGSTFFELVRSRVDLPSAVVDIGCGDGRDSYAFAQAGRAKVTGLDRSHVGVRQAKRKAEQLGLGEQLSFAACDVGDAARLHAVLTEARHGDETLLFYARFFLHSIPEDVQRTLLGVVADCARPGDWFAAEFRTERDETVRKVHGNHYRRFQNGPAFGRSLHELYRFRPTLEQEGNGFSPYRGEDPHLYRVVARRT